MTLESRLEEATLNFTNKLLHFPCRSNRDRTEYPAYLHWNYQRSSINKSKSDILLVAVADKTKREIKEAIYEGLMGDPKSIYKMSDKQRYMLHWKYVENIGTIERLQRDYK